MNFNRRYYVLCIALASFFINQSCVKKNKFTLPNEASDSNEVNDSIIKWVKAAKDKSHSISTRKQFLNNSYQTIKFYKIDTSKVRILNTIAYQNFKLGDTLLFIKQNDEALTFATKLKDTFALGDAHWNYASYYNTKQIYHKAYYHFNLAHTYFDKTDYVFESAKTQYGMAFVRGRFKDYSGSEILTFKAIKKFKKIKNYKSLYSCYDHLGQLQNDIMEYDRAIFYYNKALGYLDKIEKDKPLIEATQNNIANTYVKQKKYTKALSYYDKVLENDSLKLRNVGRYARAIDNKAFCKLLMKDTVNVFNYLKEALYVRDSINDKEGVVISKIHLAKYYAFKKDTSRAINFVTAASVMSKEIKNSRDYLETLHLLAELDTKHSSKYLERHIKFSDSLQIVERKTQNKFTRIAFETDEYIEETKRLSEQKKQILLIGLGLISILGLIIYIKIQKSKNQKLIFENKQQKSNEQAYLVALKQQEKLEKERIKDRNRIAEELHDGILGKLFGARVGLGFLDISGDENIIKKHHLFLEELQIIEKEIREVSHSLSDNFDSSQVSFTTIIRQLLENNCNIGNFKYQLDFGENINWSDINEVIKVNLYRITQEAVQNIVKYAKPKNVTVNYLLNNKLLTITIKDDGIGFKVEKKKIGIGIKNMKSRVGKLNGVMDIHSEHDKGTIIKIQIPI